MSENSNGRTPNRLIHENSPYLQQHAHNPVEWYPWSEDALSRARQEDRPILLSIGYSACHWCHVMAHESFENEEIAAQMNEHFVNIKVDREERPDLDHVYQRAAQVLGVQGGWPLTVFLTPNHRPFYAGTYFPPEDMYGRPGFPRVLQTMIRTYRNEPDRVERIAAQVTEALAEVDRAVTDGGDEEVPTADGTAQNGAVDRAAAPAVSLPDEAKSVDQGNQGEWLGLLDHAAKHLTEPFDPKYGGFGTAPKFPTPGGIELFLRHWRRTGDVAYLDRAEFTLRRMAKGGVYDQLGGGFHRYAVDREWMVPHFEKMLYDNALLPPLYLQGYQATNKPLFARIAQETLDYVLREMTDPSGGFYSTQDADSEGVEGKFYVWTPEQVKEVLGEENGALLCELFGVTSRGNFEDGATVLHLATPVETLMAKHDGDVDGLQNRLRSGRQRLLEARRRRVPPFRDEKILTGWNGLMISALARGYQVLKDRRYADAAVKAANFLLGNRLMRQGDLLRTERGEGGAVPGYLEDYAFLVAGLLDLYEATFQPRYVEAAKRLAERTVELFSDESGGGFFLTPAQGEQLIVRPKDDWDASLPSGNGTMALSLLRLHSLTGDPSYRQRAETLFRRYRRVLRQNPWGTTSLLIALDFYAQGPKEIVLAGPLQAPEGRELLDGVHSTYIPNRVIAAAESLFGTPAGADGWAEEGSTTATATPENGDSDHKGATHLLPLLEGRHAVNGQPTAYVCEDFTCSAPITDREMLNELLTS